MVSYNLYKEGLEGGGGVLIPHSRSFFTRIAHPALFVMAFPNLVYLSSKIHFVCFRGQNVDLADLGGKNFPNSQQSGKNSRVSCPNSAQYCFPRSSQFPNPVKIFCVFPDPALYFSQIPDPENTLPDPL